MNDLETCLARFTHQATTRGAAPAVSTGAATIGFAELNDRVARLAAALTASGVLPGHVVGLLLPRSADFLAGLLAVWRAGAAFVPLDPAQPDARLARILDDTGAQVILTNGSLPARRPGLVAARRIVDVTKPGDHAVPGGVCREPSARDLAYVLYTSGSTGRPKGVMVQHGALTRYVGWLLDVLPVSGPVSSLCHTSIGFDFTYSGLLTSLTTGGRIVLAPTESRLEDLGELIGSAGVDLVRLTPSHVDVLSAVARSTATRGPQVFLVGGEPLLARHVRALCSIFPDTVVYNHYGPTEGVIGRSTFQVSPAELGPESADEHAIPIGVR